MYTRFQLRHFFQICDWILVRLKFINSPGKLLHITTLSQLDYSYHHHDLLSEWCFTDRWLWDFQGNLPLNGSGKHPKMRTMDRCGLRQLFRFETKTLATGWSFDIYIYIYIERGLYCSTYSHRWFEAIAKPLLSQPVKEMECHIELGEKALTGRYGSMKLIEFVKNTPKRLHPNRVFPSNHLRPGKYTNSH